MINYSFRTFSNNPKAII